MFTGIIETTGRVLSATPVPGGRRLAVDAGVVAEDARLGASVAINGVCLTVTGIHGARLDFDVITETVGRSTLGGLQPGHRVNLERSLRPDSRLDGHFVQGHVDGVGVVVDRRVSEEEWVLWLRADETVRPYLVPKGSVALDGISLTIATVDGDRFSVAVIPTTLSLTNLEDRVVGDRMNIESDVIVRTVVHHLRSLVPTGGLTMAALREHGFA